MIDQMIKAIPEGGELRISLRRSKGRIQALVHRDFKQGDTPPLAISGTEAEMIEALPQAISQFRRVTSPLEQAAEQSDKAALAVSKKAGGKATSPAKQPSSEVAAEPADDLDLEGTVFDK